MKSLAKNQNLHIIAPVILIIFGGTAGIAAVVYDYVKKNNYKPHQEVPIQVFFKDALLAVLFLFFLSGALSSFAADLIIPGASLFQNFLPSLTQIVLGVVVTQRYLHKQNIYLTNKNFWQAFDWQAFIQKLNKGELKDILAKPQNPNQAHATSSNLSSMSQKSDYQLSQAPQSQAPIVLDQSGDGLRVKLIILALVVLLGLLSYQYVARNPELVINKAAQFLGDNITLETLTLPSE